MKNDDKTKIDFIERMGIIAQTDGMPRISGRLMGLMVLEGGPFSFSELAGRLQVSRASISTNTRLLESLGIIERTARPGDRQGYFQIAKDPYAKLLQGLTQRMAEAERLVINTQKNMPDGDHQHRLQALNSFYRGMIEAHQQLIITLTDEE